MSKERIIPSIKDILITLLILSLASIIGNIFWKLGFTETNIITVYILGVLLTSIFTKSQTSSAIYSLASVLLFNFFFTEPRLTLHAYETGYPVTFAVMFCAALITGTLANRLKENTREKEIAAVLAKNEQLRANLLRSISHDLRTPLTSISGNASNLISNYEKMDESIRKQIFQDIHDDSQWLISLVENLLSITRLEEGRMNFNMSSYLMDEVIDEAVRHSNRKNKNHPISVAYKDELLLAKMDAKLIIQVLLNLIDNAIKYTPEGTKIHITAERVEHEILVKVIDYGKGISNEIKTQVFEKLDELEKKTGKIKGTNYELIDLPGIYSLSPYTIEEEVSRIIVTLSDVFASAAFASPYFIYSIVTALVELSTFLISTNVSSSLIVSPTLIGHEATSPSMIPSPSAGNLNL